MRKFIKNETIEFQAEKLLNNYQEMYGVIEDPPIPLENILMQELGLFVTYDEIIENDGIVILGGLCTLNKEIVINSNHINLFKEKPGLERSTIGHEAGHWIFDVDESLLNHPTLDFKEEDYYKAAVTKSNKKIFAYRDNVKNVNDTKGGRIYSSKKFDTNDQARVVNRFNAALNMPYHLLAKFCNEVDLTKWPTIYRLAELFDVTPTAMKVRLEQLKFIYVKENKIYRDRDEVSGQIKLI